MTTILITGGSGTLGQAFGRLCELRGLDHHVTRREELDITDAAAIERACERHQPWAVINTAGYVRVDDAEGEPERCARENTLGPALLAQACARAGVAMVTFSTDQVFDGRKREPYDERDHPGPLNIYGRTKHAAEQQVLAAHPRALVIRTSAFFGPWDPHNFVTSTMRALAAGRVVRAAADAWVSPTYVPDLVHACLDLLIDGEGGIWHLSNRGSISWAELACAAARLGGLDADRITAVPSAELPWRAARPSYSALISEHGALLPPLADALERYSRDKEP